MGWDGDGDGVGVVNDVAEGFSASSPLVGAEGEKRGSTSSSSSLMVALPVRVPVSRMLPDSILSGRALFWNGILWSVCVCMDWQRAW